jgi:Na+/melibiose symporter-like transporter
MVMKMIARYSTYVVIVIILFQVLITLLPHGSRNTAYMVTLILLSVVFIALIGWGYRKGKFN